MYAGKYKVGLTPVKRWCSLTFNQMLQKWTRTGRTHTSATSETVSETARGMWQGREQKCGFVHRRLTLRKGALCQNAI